MSNIVKLPVIVAAPVDVHRAILATELPHARRNEPSLTARLAHVLKEWMSRAQARRELRDMDDALLRDAGLDPAQVRLETRRPFFLPLHLDRSRN